LLVAVGEEELTLEISGRRGYRHQKNSSDVGRAIIRPASCQRNATVCGKATLVLGKYACLALRRAPEFGQHASSPSP
jgi:hypothetical protein